MFHTINVNSDSLYAGEIQIGQTVWVIDDLKEKIIQLTVTGYCGIVKGQSQWWLSDKEVYYNDELYTSKEAAEVAMIKF